MIIGLFLSVQMTSFAASMVSVYVCYEHNVFFLFLF